VVVRVVVGDDARDLLGGAVELLGPTLQEVEEVAVVTSERRIRRPLPGQLERAGEHRLAVGELEALLDREDELRGVVAGGPVLGHRALQLGVVRIGVVDLREPVVEGRDDLEAVERGVQRRVDVLERVADDGAEVDELATTGTFTLAIGGLGAVCAFVAGSGVVVVAATGGEQGDGEEHRQHSQQLGLHGSISPDGLDGAGSATRALVRPLPVPGWRPY
jgi:hypothetical protein